MGSSGSVLDSADNSHCVDTNYKNNSHNNNHHNISKNNNRNNTNTKTPRASTDDRNYPKYSVSLAYWEKNQIPLPKEFFLKISYESLDFVRMENDQPIIQFPYQNIICWGSSLDKFQFKIFDDVSHRSGAASDSKSVGFDGNSAGNDVGATNTDENGGTNRNSAGNSVKNDGILICLSTKQGRTVEDTIMSTVQKLMVDINQRAISKQEFKTLLGTLFDKNQELIPNWTQVIDQFTLTNRLFLAKQGMELLIKIGEKAPFEKFDLACLLYDRIINKDSFQLLVNTFEDNTEKENLLHRLKLKNIDTTKVVSDCVVPLP